MGWWLGGGKEGPLPEAVKSTSMNTLRAALALLFLLCLSLPGWCQPKVLLQTSLGDIVVELYPKKAPITVKNFLAYVEKGLYTNARFHRTVTLHPDNQPHNKVKIEVIQSGLDPARESSALAPIRLERTSVTGVHHTDGAISMARDGPDTASSEFFICIGPQPSLDYGGKRNPDGQGFAAFGRVISGMSVVRRIQASNATGQTLDPPILIQAARLLP